MRGKAIQQPKSVVCMNYSLMNGISVNKCNEQSKGTVFGIRREE